MLSTTKLSQHAVTQSEARKETLSQNAITQTSYPSMQLPNQRPGKLDTLSQHVIETNHRLGKLDMLSQHTQHRQAIPACTGKSKLYKRCCKSPEQQTSGHSKNSCTTRRDLHKKIKQLQHLRGLGKRCEA